MGQLPHLGDALAMNARFFGDKVGARDLERALTFRQWHDRSCRLANALRGIGLQKGDRVCVLAYNCLEWVEVYAAVALAGLIAVPINFRLVGPEITYIVEDCDAKAIIVQNDLLDTLESVRSNLPIAAANTIVFGGNFYPGGARSYEKLIGSARADRPDVTVHSDDAFALMYTSGTTGRPKARSAVTAAPPCSPL